MAVWDSNSSRVLLVVLLVFVAGCSAASDGSPSTQTTTEGPTTTVVPTTPDQSTETPTQTPTPEPVDNPWGKEPVVIAIDSNVDPNRTYVEPVTRAIDYWNSAPEDQTDWMPAFVHRPDSANPDVVIRFRTDLSGCRSEQPEHVIGCASHLDADDEPDYPEIVLVQMGLTNESTFRTVRHELGHVLGLEHGEGPGNVMEPYDRVFNTLYRVHVRYDNFATDDRNEDKEQVRHALNYYADGADGHLEEEVRFAIVSEEPVADVVITFTDKGAEDGSIAEYSNGVYHITVDGIETRRRGWHVGAWLGFLFGASSVDELPPPFDGSGDDDRANWWR